MDTDNFETLVTKLGDNNIKIRHDAAVALGELGDKRAFEPLMQAYQAETESVHVRSQIIIALGRLGAERAFPLFVETLRDENPDIVNNARVAATTLAMNGGSDVVEMLVATLSDGDEQIRRWASDTLGYYVGADRALAPLIATFKSDKPVVIEEALNALSYFNQPSAIKRLIAALADGDIRVRYYSALALGDIGNELALPALTALQQSDPDEQVRQAAAYAVAQVSRG